MATGVVGTPGGPPPGYMMPKPGQDWRTYQNSLPEAQTNPYFQKYLTAINQPGFIPQPGYQYKPGDVIDPMGRGNWQDEWRQAGLDPATANWQGGQPSTGWDVRTGRTWTNPAPQPPRPTAQPQATSPLNSYMTPGFTTQATGANPIQQAMQNYQANLRSQVPQQYQQYLPANFAF